MSSQEVDLEKPWQALVARLTAMIPILDMLRYLVQGGEHGNDVSLCERGLKECLQWAEGLDKLYEANKDITQLQEEARANVQSTNLDLAKKQAEFERVRVEREENLQDREARLQSAKMESVQVQAELETRKTELEQSSKDLEDKESQCREKQVLAEATLQELNEKKAALKEKDKRLWTFTEALPVVSNTLEAHVIGLREDRVQIQKQEVDAAAIVRDLRAGIRTLRTTIGLAPARMLNSQTTTATNSLETSGERSDVLMQAQSIATTIKEEVNVLRKGRTTDRNAIRQLEVELGTQNTEQEQAIRQREADMQRVHEKVIAGINVERRAAQNKHLSLQARFTNMQTENNSLSDQVQALQDSLNTAHETIQQVQEDELASRRQSAQYKRKYEDQGTELTNNKVSSTSTCVRQWIVLIVSNRDSAQTTWRRQDRWNWNTQTLGAKSTDMPQMQRKLMKHAERHSKPDRRCSMCRVN